MLEKGSIEVMTGFGGGQFTNAHMFVRLASTIADREFVKCVAKSNGCCLTVPPPAFSDNPQGFDNDALFGREEFCAGVTVEGDIGASAAGRGCE
jgi:hypothetical protein